MLSLLLSLLPTFLVKLVGAIVPAATDAARALVDDRIQQSKERIALGQNARDVRIATAGHWEMRMLAFTAGFVAVAHWTAIGVGTVVAAPLKAAGYAIPGWLGWTLLIPNMPPPWDSYTGPILLSFFGLVGVQTAASKIAGAIALRKR
jgi:hypothetical protein